MQGHIHDTTAIKPAHSNRRGRVGLAILLAIISVGLLLPLGRSPLSLVDSTTTVAPHASLSVAPVDPAQIAALVRQQAKLRERLSAQIAPVDPAQIAALVRQHETLRTQLGVTVAPVNPAQIAALVLQAELGKH
jgi:hypothetical protein